MRASLPRSLAVALTLPALIVGALATPAPAHEERAAGPLEMVVGWFEEPAFSGFRNAVQVRLSRDGRGVTGATLKAVVIFGDRNGKEKTAAMSLNAAFGSPGEYRAFLVPTRPGVYTFHVTGTAAGTKIDEFFTASDTTFHPVVQSSETEFPVKDPSRGELGDKQTRLESRLDETRLSAAAAKDDASGATTLAIVGIALGALGIVSGLLGRRRSKA